MKKTPKTTPAADPARKRAVMYARVSSKEQEKEGFSIPAQLKLLKDYAVANGFAVAQEYVDVETAKQSGRTAFGEMVANLKAQPAVRVMLVEKTDRLYRNLKDWVTVDELEVEIHFPKEGVVLSRDGIAGAYRRCQFDGFSSVIRLVSLSHRHSSPPTSMLDLATFSRGSSAGGRSR
jgi:hypothetical protein